MKQIIRIEHGTLGTGLWRSYKVDPDNGTTNIINDHSNYEEISNRHCERDFPSYQEDSILQLKIIERNHHIRAYNFAFNSLEYFEKALTREETKECIEKLDFKVYSITVSDWIESKYQVIYKPEDVVSKEDISFMFI